MSDEVTRTRDDVAEVAREAARHLAWLADAGVRELPRAAASDDRSSARAGARPAGVAAGGERVGGAATSAPVRRVTSTPTPTPTPTSTSTPTATPTSPPNATRASSRASAGAGRWSLEDKGCGSPELLAIRAELGECARCGLVGGRTTLVFGVGNPRAELMFVGEGPGADEDRQGEPFVGRAGQLLTKMIEAMGFRREEVYIANVVKCRPPENRNPEPDEMDACEPFLRRQIAAVGPKIVVALGRIAVQALLKDTTPISRLRGRWTAYEGVKLMPTFHPAYLLRSPDEKKKAWEDLQLVMKELGKPVARR